VTSTEAASSDLPEPSSADRDLRRSLEGSPSLEALWPHLSHSDRWIRYAARVALERHPVASWRNKDLPLGGLLALARLGTPEDLPRIVDRVTATPWDPDALRVLQVAFVRLGAPEGAARTKALAWLDPRYPSGSFPVDRELVQLLVYLEADKVIGRTLRLQAESKVQEEQMHFAFVLRNVKSGWTSAEREQYFRWFGNFSDYKGDIGFPLFLRNVRTDALKTVSAEERKALQSILDSQFRKDSAVFQRTAPVVQKWKPEELLPDVEKPGAGRRNFTRGKAAFAKAQCLACHSFAGEGGAVGPDLTGVSKRLNHRDLFEAVFYPSKNVSDQYQNTLFQLDDGNVVLGRRVDEDKERIVVAPDLLTDERVPLQKHRIVRTKPSALSPMPEGLLDTLTKFEVLDLFAYLQSDGKE
jgi:putative heme-binding domain-containing protein